METWRKELYLAHHGILGQKWGKKMGPPYPLDGGDHSASEKKAGWRDSIKEKKIAKRKKMISDASQYAYNEMYRNRRLAYANGAIDIQHIKDSNRPIIIKNKRNKYVKLDEKFSKILDKYDNTPYSELKRKDFREAKRLVKKYRKEYPNSFKYL